METYDNQLSSLFFQAGDIVDNIIFCTNSFCKFVNTSKTYFYAFDIHNLCSVIAEIHNTGCVQYGDGIGITLLSIVTTVIIRKVGCFN